MGSKRVVALCAAIGLALVAGPAAAGTGGSSTAIVTKVKRSDLVLGEKTTIEAQVRNAPAGFDPQLQLFERPFPYRREALVGPMTARPNGTYALRVRPRRNTRYVVRSATDATLESSRRPVAWVYPRRVAAIAKVVKPRIGAARMIFNIARDHPYRFRGRRLLFYFRKEGNPVFHRVAKTRVKRRRAGRYTGRARFPLPNGNYRFFVSWCFETSRSDVGVGRPAPTKCPNRFRPRDAGKSSESPFGAVSVMPEPSR